MEDAGSDCIKIIRQVASNCEKRNVFSKSELKITYLVCIFKIWNEKAGNWNINKKGNELTSENPGCRSIYNHPINVSASSLYTRLDIY
ncbi:hypothetical protein BHE18_13630 [Rossellomorea aquimaris]|uniref:Uncharacterized protein n=1 Tax=Rossellomorea aquimaris TaxID=189382 RepID=A0A1J6WG04_9BACI|nr:hypothetical protein BHE18_13630 [Rossellomorea aquimaris]